jgi:F-type H+-transporting ATPase subunit alpha
VGGKAQRAAYRAVAGDLKLAYAQFEELETFARFGARLDDASLETLEHGRRLRACLRQPEFAPVPLPEQLAVLLALTSGLFRAVPLLRMAEAEQAVRQTVTSASGAMLERLDQEGLSDDDRETLIRMARQALLDAGLTQS